MDLTEQEINLLRHLESAAKVFNKALSDYRRPLKALMNDPQSSTILGQLVLALVQQECMETQHDLLNKRLSEISEALGQLED